MRIGVFAGNSNPEVGGGYTFESQVLETLFKLAYNSRHQFISCNSSQKLQKNTSEQAIECISLNRTFKERLISKFYRELSAIFSKSSYTINQFEKRHHDNIILRNLVSNDIDITLSLSPTCITEEVPYITIVWDLQHRLQPYFPEVSIAGEWETREKHYATLLRRATFIITGTEVGKAEIERFYQVPSERIKVLPLPTPQFALLNSSSSKNTKILNKYKIPEKYLFYPGQFWSHKNHAGLLLAIKYLRDKYNLILPVIFAGSNQGNQLYIKQLVDELELSEQVYFLGFVPQEDIISLYQNAFALSFVTFFGPDNLPPLEAFALECPVIASNVSGAEEQLGDAALLVNPKKPEEIAIAIKSLWDNATLRQTLIQRGLVRAFKWTTEDYVKGLISILNEFEAIQRCWK